MTGCEADDKLNESGKLLWSPRVSRGGAQGYIASGDLRKHNVPRENSLFRPSCGFINLKLQRRTEGSDNMVPGKHLALAPNMKL